MTLAIDPGASGGFAWKTARGDIDTYPMPEGMTEQAMFIWQKLSELALIAGCAIENITVVLEKVGGYMPGNSGPASVKFARHCGNLEAICFCYGASVVQVAPQTWMKSIGTMPKNKTERKNAIKEAMARKYPNIRVTLKTADALGMLSWYLEKQNDNRTT